MILSYTVSPGKSENTSWNICTDAQPNSIPLDSSSIRCPGESETLTLSPGSTDCSGCAFNRTCRLEGNAFSAG